MRGDFGLGRQIRLAFWGMLFLEAAFGSYMGIWPLWIERLGAPVTVVGLVIGSSGILRLFVLLPSAALGERFGVRRLVVAARIAALLGLASAALATHWTHLGLMILGSAIGELAFPLVQAHVTNHAGTARIRAFTFVFTVGPSIALAATPLLSGFLIQVSSLRAAFVLAGVCTAASITCFWRLSPHEPVPAGQRATGASYATALGDRAVRRLLILQGGSIFSLALGTSLIPTFLEDERGLTPAAIASLGALAAVGSTIFGLAVTRLGALQRAPFVGAAIAIGSSAIGFALFIGGDALPLICLAFVCRGGFFSTWATFSAAIGDAASAVNRARSFALSDTIAGVGFSLAPMLAGPLYTLDAHAPLAVACALALSLVPTLLVIQRRARREGAARGPDLVPVAVDARTAPADAPAG